ncbi:TlpA disulfide reductase family protein [Mechercharimyces sp. CAU 1602]|uniref:TlpA family protein disulfide reductase n=1 Tax=Mechercharimyces sp. CAU 1602 TaxID=2973933 RepID=UPI0021626D0B|nr:TlpA disulfide reductase family protein [Mechercharimyces sp. CAU 1602]MCS1351903.1 TlpA family protein disulfide reductase [Mechercharimyces sp. CAU 1602]
MSTSDTNFCLPSLQDGKHFCLNEYHGKLILLTFWVTWCPACQSDLPKKEVFYRSMQSEHIQFFSINVSGREPQPTEVPSYIEEHGFTFPVLLDRGRQVYDQYGITSVPTTILIDRQGIIQGRYDEHVPFSDIIADLGTLLSST